MKCYMLLQGHFRFSEKLIKNTVAAYKTDGWKQNFTHHSNWSRGHIKRNFRHSEVRYSGMDEYYLLQRNRLTKILQSFHVKYYRYSDTSTLIHIIQIWILPLLKYTLFSAYNLYHSKKSRFHFFLIFSNFLKHEFAKNVDTNNETSRKCSSLI